MQPTPGPTHRLALSAVLGLGLAFATPAQAAPQQVQTDLARPIEDLSYAESAGLEQRGPSLLLADGSFGSVTRDYSSSRPRLELFTFGRPGGRSSRTIRVTGAPAGALSYPNTQLSGVDGYHWVLQASTRRQPHGDEQGDAQDGLVREPGHLTAFDDRGRTVRTVRLSRSVDSAMAVATGAGIRLLTRDGDKSGVVVRTASGRQLGRIPKLVTADETVVGRPDGSLVLSGIAARGSAWGGSLVEVSAGGRASLLRDSRNRLVPGAPLAQTGRGLVFGTVSGTTGESAIGLLKANGTRVARAVSALELDWNPACDVDAYSTYRLNWAVGGSSGAPVVGVTCTQEADRTELILDSYVVGLDSNLRVRWFAKPTIPTLQRYDQRLPEAQVGADGRLAMVLPVNRDGNGVVAEIERIRVPGGASSPHRGRVLSVSRSGRGAVATIRCSLPEGTVCAGTAKLSRGGRAVSVPYALRGRPGQRAAVLKRHFPSVPAGRGSLRVTLTK